MEVSDDELDARVLKLETEDKETISDDELDELLYETEGYVDSEFVVRPVWPYQAFLIYWFALPFILVLWLDWKYGEILKIVFQPLVGLWLFLTPGIVFHYTTLIWLVKGQNRRIEDSIDKQRGRWDFKSLIQSHIVWLTAVAMVLWGGLFLSR